MPTPSEYLAKNLRDTGHALGVGERSAKFVDLSKVNPHRRLSKSELRKHKGPARTYDRPQRHRLQTILGEYIRLVGPILSRTTVHNHEVNDLDTALGEVFRADSHNYLRKRGYDVEDVVAWAWILKSKNHHQAVSRMFALEADCRSRHDAKSSHIPLFIPLLLLKERQLDARSFRLLFIYSLHLMSGQPLPLFGLHASSDIPGDLTPEKFQPHSNLDPTTCMIMIVRLIRHARMVWPEAMPTIACAFSRFLAVTDIDGAGRQSLNKNKINQFKTDKFNACLWLLSLPTKANPFRSASIRQQAQFELLRAMASHKPVLPLTRKGYQAVIAVQVAHKKTVAERQSAELKAPSWPPWKEEKLGIDAQRGNEGMYSRAMNVLSQMRDAGYSYGHWEETAAIVAGWDTDHSPTVQTRTLLHRPRFWSRARRSDPNHYTIWTARIRATRTVREAWACFLSYQDKGLPLKHAIYAAMAEKLIHREKAVKNGFDQTSHALPGDGREVHPEPASARDIIYVHTEPPTLEEFIDKMISQGTRPSGRFLAMLLQSAPDFRSGMRYLQSSALTEDQITALCTTWYQLPENGPPTINKARCGEAVQALPDHVFASFVKFLCSPQNVISQRVHRDTLSTDRFPVLVANGPFSEPLLDLSDHQEEFGPKYHPKALWHAVQLANLRQPICHEAWSHILSAVSGDRLSRRESYRSRDLYRILAWQEAVKVLGWMKSRNIDRGFESFNKLCVAFARAVIAGQRHIGLTEEAYRLVHRATHHGAPIEPNGHGTFDDLVTDGLELLKSEFDDLVLPASRISEPAEQSIFAADHSTETELRMPTILHVPPFATLHIFVRALGAMGDDVGLLHLLRWMSRSAGPLNELADEYLNGDKARRQTLAAMRVFLERLEHGPIDSARITSDPKVQEAYDIISRTPDWEWPSDADVEEYLR